MGCALSGEDLKLKVLGREFEGDSPQCGEMSRSDRGDRLRQRNPFSKGFPSIPNIFSYVKIMAELFALYQIIGAYPDKVISEVLIFRADCKCISGNGVLSEMQWRSVKALAGCTYMPIHIE